VLLTPGQEYRERQQAGEKQRQLLAPAPRAHEQVDQHHWDHDRKVGPPATGHTADRSREIASKPATSNRELSAW
jgi:hypothetical protein